MWMHLEDCHTDWRESEKDKYHMIAPICGIQKNMLQMKLFTESDVENKHLKSASFSRSHLLDIWYSFTLFQSPSWKEIMKALYHYFIQNPFPNDTSSKITSFLLLFCFIFFNNHFLIKNIISESKQKECQQLSRFFFFFLGGGGGCLF